MKRLLPALAISLCASAFGQENVFTQASLDQDGARLWLHRADGSKATAPKLQDQDAFGEPAVSSTRRHVGWLALFPNHGASYSQPLYLVVMDTSNRIQRFNADFGMVFGWCFTPGGKELVFRAAFPHGLTPVEFQMRRISDGRLLRRFKLPEGRDGPMPSWASCAHSSEIPTEIDPHAIPPR